MDENSLTHYGVMGMKWGRRKSKSSKGSNVKNSNKSKSNSKKTSSIKKNIQNITSKIDKEKVKKIAKTSAKVAGAVATTALLGSIGTMAYSQMISLVNEYSNNMGNTIDQVRSGSTNKYPQINKDAPLYKPGFIDSYRNAEYQNKIRKNQLEDVLKLKRK